ncbi:MAG: hypothetical protein KY468_08650 [Armatimonadetes bacterium]|nr:hypothetical protein [Armatimonadota bacterium]
MSERDEPITEEKAENQWRYVAWGVMLWLAVTAVILMSGGNSKFIYIDF